MPLCLLNEAANTVTAHERLRIVNNTLIHAGACPGRGAKTGIWTLITTFEYVSVQTAAINAVIRCSDRSFANNTGGLDERNRRCVLAVGGAPEQEHRHGRG